MSTSVPESRVYKGFARKLWVLLAEGKSEDEAREELGVAPGKFDGIKECMFALQAERLQSQSTDRVYAEYVLKQLQNAHALSEVVKAAKSQATKVQAVKARSEIWDKVIKVGQEFGVLEKRPEEKRIVAGVLVANLSDVQLRQAITSELSGLNKLVAAHGDLDISELEPGKLHYALPEPHKSRTHKAKANKVHKGRRVVKEKPLQ